MIKGIKTKIAQFLKYNGLHWTKGVDIGCGRGEALPIIRDYVTHITGVDKTYINEMSFARGYDKLVIADVKEYEPDIDTEIVFLFDLIEHLEKGDGFSLLNKLQRVPNIIITTPYRYFEDAGRGQRHLSLWTIDDFYDYDREIFIARSFWIFGMPIILAYRFVRGERF